MNEQNMYLGAYHNGISLSGSRVAITSTPETVLHHGFGGLLYGRHRSGITFPPAPLHNRRLFARHFAVPKNNTVMQFIN